MPAPTFSSDIANSRASKDARVQLSLDFQWQSLGEMQSPGTGVLDFPLAPGCPGLYRFRLCRHGRPRHYIGETDNLRRRFQQYRTPGASQQTNIRMNNCLTEHLGSGGTIAVDISTGEIVLSTRGETIPANLANKATRRLLEHAALVIEVTADAELLNR